MATQKRKFEDERVERVREAFDLSWQFCTTDFNGTGSAFERAQRASMAYERVMEADQWQTRSQIYFPFAKNAVNTALPNIMKYVFNEDNLFELIPVGNRISYENAQAVRNYLHYKINTVMNVPLAAYTTIKTACKLGVGYGIVDLEYATPWHWEHMSIEGVDNDVQKYEQGQIIHIPRYRNIPFVRVLPSPGGGVRPQDRDWVIHVDHIPESELKAMIESEDCPVNGNFNDIVQDTKDNNIDGRVCPMESLYGSWLTNERATFRGAEMVRKNDYNLPVLIPVIKYYGRNEHIWVANGNTVILHHKDKAQSARNPILKADFSPDNDDWFSEGLISPNEDLFMTENILNNTIMDMIDLISRPRFLKNVQSIHGEINMHPFGVTDVYGPTKEALTLLDTGRVPPETIAMLDRLHNTTNLMTGQSDQMQGIGATGVMRGGAQAFESLLSSASGRDKLAADVIDSGFVKDLVESLMLVEQLAIGIDNRQDYLVSDTDEKGKAVYQNMTITSSELRNDFKVSISLRDKIRNSLADANKRMGEVQLIMQTPHLARNVNPDAILDYLINDRVAVRKLKAGANPQEYDAVQELLASMGAKAPQGASQPASPQPGAGVPGNGGASGGMQQQAAINGGQQ